nr:helical backbone metal receptor [uncultured Allomuricauda sp.]
MKPLLLEDQMGRQLCLKQPLSRIVSLNPSQTETLVDLGLEHHIVGLTKFCVHPFHLRQSKTIVGGTKKVDFAKIRHLKPDIILCNKEENTKEMVDTLAKEYPVHVTNVSNLQDALEMIHHYGQLFNCPKEAQKLCNRILSEKTEFESLIKKNEPKRVAYFIWKNPWMVCGGGTFINDMLQLNGYKNAFDDSERYPEVNLDDLKRRAVDLVLLSSEPYPFKEKNKVELEKHLGIHVKLVDGTYFSWYGSRLKDAFRYFRSLHGH